MIKETVIRDLVEAKLQHTALFLVDVVQPQAPP